MFEVERVGDKLVSKATETEEPYTIRIIRALLYGSRSITYTWTMMDCYCLETSF